MLLASQRSSHIKRRKAIWEALHPAPKMSPAFTAVFGQELADAAVLCDENGVPIEDESKTEVEQVVPPQAANHGGARPQVKSFAAETAAITGAKNVNLCQQVIPTFPNSDVRFC